MATWCNSEKSEGEVDSRDSVEQSRRERRGARRVFVVREELWVELPKRQAAFSPSTLLWQVLEPSIVAAPHQPPSVQPADNLPVSGGSSESLWGLSSPADLGCYLFALPFFRGLEEATFDALQTLEGCRAKGDTLQ
ncbi:hypothetical protein DMENIID0001_004890 [Sergentomyia squamirostris]